MDYLILNVVCVFEMPAGLIYVNQTGLAEVEVLEVLRISHSSKLRHPLFALAMMVASCRSGLTAEPCAFEAALPDRALSIHQTGDILLESNGLVRLAAVDWPPRDKVASRRLLTATLHALLMGESLRLVPVGARDRWGRLPVRLAAGEGGDRVWIEGQLLEEGLLRAWPEGAGDPCWGAALEREAQARTERIGLWSAVGQRAQRGQLRGAEGRSGSGRVVFTGIVRSVRAGRAVTFVNFVGPRGRTPSWMMSRRQMEQFRKAGRDPATFTGKTLRLRATLGASAAGRLEVAGPMFMEILE